MTTVAVLADPPREGLVLSRLPKTTPLSPSEAADLYAASLTDVVRSIATSGGTLLVNYRPDDLVPDEYAGEESAETEVRALVDAALDGADVDGDADDARLEVQVGSNRAARVGNTVTHLLEREGVASAAVVEASAALLGRTHVDNAAMKLRRSEVVLGPAQGGRTYFAGFSDTVDFEGADAPPELETLADRALDAGHQVDFVPMLPTLDTADGLASTISLVRSRRSAGLAVPTATASLLDDLGLRVAEEGGERRVVRG